MSRFVLALIENVAAETDRGLRAALIGAHLSGLLLNRYLFKVTALASAEFDTLVDAAAPTINPLPHRPARQMGPRPGQRAHGNV